MKEALSNQLKQNPAMPMLAVLMILFSTLSPYFFDAINMESIAANNAVILIAAVGMTLVFLTGGIDLSIATVISVSAVMAGVIMGHTDNVLLGVLTAVSVGAAFGLLNGFLIGFLGLSPFITTMGTQLIARGIAFSVSEGIAVQGTPEPVIDFGFALVMGIPKITLVSFAVLLIVGFLVALTSWGRYIILLGSNPLAARYCGLNTRWLELSVYLASGILGGIAGFISIANLGNALPGVGDTLLLIIIGAVVLGGTSMNGGEGSLTKTLFGVAVLAVLTNGLNLLGIPFYDQLMIQGALIFIGYSIAMRLNQAKR
ncbi:ABC transporter permease [Gayadomonas joobiniege]|uniref:ABC transporter permease n=1 Tax=Gayadomonas joobiniege TaxID=1234606 RepID=UPI00037C42AD|nr:ABC transporter permease [Gayadomonas joobiniege]